MPLDGRFEVFTSLHPAKFRGVDFYVEAVGTEGGLKGSVREIINSSHQVFDDVGVKRRTYRVRGYVSARVQEQALNNETNISTSYEEHRIRLIAALEDREPATLIHPVEGTIERVVAQNWSLDESSTESGIGRISITFVVSSTQPVPTIEIGTPVGVVEGADAVDASVLSSIEDNWEVSLSFIDSYQDALDKQLGVYNRMQAVAQGVRVKLASVDNYFTKINTAIANAPSLVLSPEEMAQNIADIFTASRTIFETTNDSFTAITNMFDFGDADVSIDTSTPGGFEKQKNRDVLNMGIKSFALAQAYRDALDLEYVTDVDIATVEDILEDQHDSIAESGIVDEVVLQNLIDLRSLFYDFLIEARVSARKITEESVAPTTPRVLSHLLYGDDSFSDTLSGLNSLDSYEILEGTVKVLSA